MKIKLLMIGLLGLISATTFAQKGELNNAKNSYNDYQVARGQKILASRAKASLADAKTSIDKASTNAKTSGLPDTYATKAAIYASIAADDSVQTTSAVEFTTASDALKQAKTLDTKNENTQLIDQTNKVLAQILANKGVTEFQNKKFDDAYKSFTSARQLLPTDTLMMLNSAISATNSQNFKAAISNYNDLLASNYSSKSKIYNDLPNLYLANKDTAGAVKSIDEALVKYPANADLRKFEIEIALQTGKLSGITSKLDDAIKSDPKNKVLYYYAGLTYSEMGDADQKKSLKAKDDATKKAITQTADDEYAKAAPYYQKAIDLDPNYFEAYFNYGYILMQPAVILFNYGRNLPAAKEKEYQAVMTKVNTQFDIAKPYLQKAVDLNPKSVDALINLRNYYKARFDPAHTAENNAKAEALTKQINALSGTPAK